MNRKKIDPTLKAVLEYGPLIGFFAAYMFLKDRVFTFGGTDYEGFIVVTALFIPIFLIAMGIQWKLTGHLSKMQALTAVLIVVFGGLSVWLNDDRFFKMKPTMIYGFFGGALALGLMRGKSWLQSVMDSMLPLQEEGWMILTKRIMLFFFGMAIANELVWRTMSTESWVYFKTFGLPIAIFGFFLTQSGLFSKYSTDETDAS